MIAIIDYGAGNLTSVRKAFAAIGAHTWTPSVPGELGRAHGIVVPGVGHFDATSAITNDWRAAIETMVKDGIPVLGICVGLQWLFEGSDEAPEAEGACIFAGRCFNLGTVSPMPQAPSRRPQALSPRPLKVPHVGWNSLSLPRESHLMKGVSEGSQVYFTHSYAAPIVADTAAITEYGVPFSAAVERANVAAVQFHPEKSGDVGLRILSNWLATTDSDLSRRSSGGA
ncbi:MAG TPA: imidazole glycerol phosphate synthase subunit HisH [Vicinamibacterales bacterium]|nr:imidazole glycerol phosphate synthase subunit HisH [Vicinamibacterales bacterium]